MSDGSEDRSTSGVRGPVLRSEVVRYALAALGYIAITMVTKQYLAFTWGPLYFVAVLEILPRLVRRLRNRGAGPARLGPVARDS